MRPGAVNGHEPWGHTASTDRPNSVRYPQPLATISVHYRVHRCCWLGPLRSHAEVGLNASLLQKLRQRAADRMTPEIEAVDRAARDQRAGRVRPSAEELDSLREQMLDLVDHRPEVPGSRLRQRVGWKLERALVHGTSPALQDLRASLIAFDADAIRVLAAVVAELDDCRSQLRRLEARVSALEAQPRRSDG